MEKEVQIYVKESRDEHGVFTGFYKDRQFKTLHNLDGPAKEYPSGKQEWWIDGVQLTKLKFEKKARALKAPEYTKIVGEYKEWFKDEACTVIHRENDLPARVHLAGRYQGTQEWIKEGKQHRIGAPSYIRFLDGTMDAHFWKMNGLLHRFDGPAIYNPQVLTGYEYHVDGVKLTSNLQLILGEKLNQQMLWNARRILRESYDTHRSELISLGFTLISSEANEQLYGTQEDLYAPIRVLYLRDASTDKRVLLRVPYWLDTVEESLEWSFSQGNGQYKPEIQT